MKWIPLILAASISSSGFAAVRTNRLLKCLGEEEKRFHLQKDTGPFYELNQKLLAELIQIPNPQISDADFRYVCHGERHSESWKFLKLSIEKGHRVFELSPQLGTMQREVSKGMIEDYVEATKEVFINFINQIQMGAPNSKCLLQEIPPLGEFFADIKHLQEDIDLKAIFKGRDEKIVQELRNYPKAYERCRARMRKKPSSGSTTEARKR